MSTHDRPLFLLLCVIIGLLLALLFMSGFSIAFKFSGGEGCDQKTFGCFLYRWQTLIAGVLAISGAAWTVAKIEKQIRIAQRSFDEEEIRILSKEKNKFIKEISVELSEYETEEEIFSKWVSFYIREEVVSCCKNMRNFEYDPIILTNSIHEMRNQTSRCADEGIKLCEKSRAQSIAARAKAEESARKINPASDGHSLLSQTVYGDAANESLKRAHEKIKKARNNYLAEIDRRIDILYRKHSDD